MQAAARRPDGGVKVFDDFREAYMWLSENTGGWCVREEEVEGGRWKRSGYLERMQPGTHPSPPLTLARSHPRASLPAAADPNAKVASWWDYGYQTTAMANRTVIVDNNTWNNTHIATVGRAMSSPERKAWQIFRSLDVEYVFVVFGGFIGYPSDDINKFLWMVRIGGGVFPEIKEPNYLGADGE